MRTVTLPVRTDLAPTPLFASLTRPILIGGLEREVMVPLVTVVLGLLVQLTLAAWAVAALLVTTLLPELRRRTKADPQMLAVVKGHLAVAGDYRPQGEPGVRAGKRVRTF